MTTDSKYLSPERREEMRVEEFECLPEPYVTALLDHASLMDEKCEEQRRVIRRELITPEMDAANRRSAEAHVIVNDNKAEIAKLRERVRELEGADLDYRGCCTLAGVKEGELADFINDAFGWKEHLARCREVLREVEWRTPLPYEQCPSCRGLYADHAPDCKLAAVLKEMEEK